MNRKYITRQITSHKLGIPMSKDIKKYYDCFYQLIGDINELEELVHDDYPNTIFWRKDGKVILEYKIKNECFWVDYYTIWSKFEEKYRLNYNNISSLLGGMLEDAFKLKVTTTFNREILDVFLLEEAFKIRVPRSN